MKFLHSFFYKGYNFDRTNRFPQGRNSPYHTWLGFCTRYFHYIFPDNRSLLHYTQTSFFHFIYLFHSLSHRHMWGWVIQVILTHTWFSTNRSLCIIIPLCILSSVIIIYNILFLPLQVLSGLIRVLVSDPWVYLQALLFNIQTGKNVIVFSNGYFCAIWKVEFHFEYNNIACMLCYTSISII